MSQLIDLAARLDALRAARVTTVGDVMMDRFVYGTVERISPEGPIPVLRIQRETAVLGGAGNVLRNLLALGADGCFVSVVGDDPAGHGVTRLVAAEPRVEPHLLVEAGRQTTVKTRFVAGSHQLLRADQEEISAIRPATVADLLRRTEEALTDSGALTLSDYGKGVLCPETLRALLTLAQQKRVPVIVDPKGRDWSRYNGATLVTPNKAELAEATGLPTHDDAAILNAARHILATTTIEAVLVTRSQDGMTLVTRDAAPFHVSATAREVYDVSGAGDTVVAGLAAALAAGFPLQDACLLANAAAGIVVGKIGTAVCRLEELSAALQGRDLAADEEKILARSEAVMRVAAWRRQGLRIGFTNGCFDLIHPGHVSLLAQSKAACDRLIVGLNTDASVKRLKGDSRPIQSEMARAIVLASMAAVDAVILFGEDTPYDLIAALEPDVLVKGADYTVETVVGSDLVLKRGGKVVLANLEAGFSTTNMVKKVTAAPNSP